jgi:hypothetical protein
MGYLQQHARPVTGLVIRAFRAPVFHTFQNLKPTFQYLVRSPSLNIRDKPDAARVMLISRPIQPLRGTLLRQQSFRTRLMFHTLLL